MNTLKALLPYIQIIISVLAVTAVLLQQKSAGLGGAFGENNNFSGTFHSRRGFEKFLFSGTIVLGILFAVATLLALRP